MNRYILHVDMNNYFASVEEKYNSKLKLIPFAVCGDPKMRHNIVMSKNELAKKAGVKTGLSFIQAKQICSNLVYIKANYAKYLKETKQARDIYKKYTNKITMYGMDEAWLDLTETCNSFDEALQIANLIRIEILYTQKLSASIGVSDNLIYAKLGSDYKKPNAITLINKDNCQEIVYKLPATDLLFVGEKRGLVLKENGINTIGDIVNSNKELLVKLFGKNGSDIHKYAKGDDSSFNPETEKIKSIGNTITLPNDLVEVKEISAVLYLLIEIISVRLKSHNYKGYCVSISFKNNKFESITRSKSNKIAFNDIGSIYEIAYNLFINNYVKGIYIRSIGVRVSNLTNDDQTSVVDNKEYIDDEIKKLVEKYRKLEVEKTSMSKEW